MSLNNPAKEFIMAKAAKMAGKPAEAPVANKKTDSNLSVYGTTNTMLIDMEKLNAISMLIVNAKISQPHTDRLHRLIAKDDRGYYLTDPTWVGGVLLDPNRVDNAKRTVPPQFICDLIDSIFEEKKKGALSVKVQTKQFTNAMIAERALTWGGPRYLELLNDPELIDEKQPYVVLDVPVVCVDKDGNELGECHDPGCECNCNEHRSTPDFGLMGGCSCMPAPNSEIPGSVEETHEEPQGSPIEGDDASPVDNDVEEIKA